MSIQSLFSRQKIPTPPPTPPPKPVKNTLLEAETASMGRRQGLVAALFGYKNPSGTSGGAHNITGSTK